MSGEAGTGKTTLIRKLLCSLPEGSLQLSLIINPALTTSELLESVLMDFGLKEIPPSKAIRLSLFKQMLVRADHDGKISVLVVDEAHLLSTELVEEIRLLSNFETSERKLLQIVLAGQSPLDDLLNLPPMTQLKQRVAIRTQLEALDNEYVEPYIRTRWKRAGGPDRLPFCEDAIAVIARASGGIPRVINVVCDAALVNAYGTRAQEITRKDLREVFTDLQLGSS